MPGLSDITKVLVQNRRRFDSLDAFADDIDEIRTRSLEGICQVIRTSPRPILAAQVGTETLLIELFAEQGIARFRLLPGEPSTDNSEVAALTAVGGLLGVALGAASKTKEGLLGGLVLGMLVGAAVGVASQPVERVLALQFEQATANWRLYDGPLLSWAKRTLQPAA